MYIFHVQYPKEQLCGFRLGQEVGCCIEEKVWCRRARCKELVPTPRIGMEYQWIIVGFGREWDFSRPLARVFVQPRLRLTNQSIISLNKHGHVAIIDL